MQKRRADEVRRVACSKLSHRLGAMALEGPWADAHPQGPLLVGISLADKAQDLALALRQGLLAGIGGKHHARRARSIPGVARSRLPSSLASRQSDRRLVRARDLLHHGANTL